MKIGLISDVHSNNYVLKELIETEEDIDSWLCAGDICGLFPNVDEVVELIQKKNILSVKGNHEEVLLDENLKIESSFTGNQSLVKQRREIADENKKFLQSLPEKLEVTLEGRKILVVHELQPEMSKYIFDWQLIQVEFNYDIIVFGHTHLPSITYLKNTLVVNPGSLGFPVDKIRKPSYMVIDLKTLDVYVRRLDCSSDGLINDIKQKEYNTKLIDYIKNGYVWQ